jgi:PQQ-dependent catabolism-associated CXXCW motif protein
MLSGGISRRTPTCWALAFLMVAPGVAAAGEVTEPKSYWTGPMHGNVPATLAHGHVIHAQELADMLALGAPILIDVAERPHRPDALAADTVWMLSAHRDIPGSQWIPGVGLGTLGPSLLRFYQARLAALTRGDLDKDVVVYCHAHCWGSWNAAKRAISFGYHKVYWYPEGVEGWQDAGLDLAAAQDGGLVQGNQ